MTGWQGERTSASFEMENAEQIEMLQIPHFGTFLWTDHVLHHGRSGDLSLGSGYHSTSIKYRSCTGK